MLLPVVRIAKSHAKTCMEWYAILKRRLPLTCRFDTKVGKDWQSNVLGWKVSLFVKRKMIAQLLMVDREGYHRTPVCCLLLERLDVLEMMACLWWDMNVFATSFTFESTRKGRLVIMGWSLNPLLLWLISLLAQ
jgi:hypothetical protein